MEAFLTGVSLITVIEIILVLLIPIAIIGIWTEATKTRKIIERTQEIIIEEIIRNSNVDGEMIRLLSGNNQMMFENINKDRML